MVTLGMAHLAPSGTAGVLTNNSGGFLPSIQTDSYKQSSMDAWIASVGYGVTDDIALKFSFGMPPNTTASISNQLTGGVSKEIATLRYSSPTLMANYFFRPADASFRPFIAAGVAYTWFSDIRLSPTGAALASSGKVDSVWAPEVSLGFNYRLSEKVSLLAALSYTRMKTTMTVNDYLHTGTQAKVDLNLKVPSAALSLGYSF